MQPPPPEHGPPPEGPIGAAKNDGGYHAVLSIKELTADRTDRSALRITTPAGHAGGARPAGKSRSSTCATSAAFGAARSGRRDNMQSPAACTGRVRFTPLGSCRLRNFFSRSPENVSRKEKKISTPYPTREATAESDRESWVKIIKVSNTTRDRHHRRYGIGAKSSGRHMVVGLGTEIWMRIRECLRS